MASICNDSGGRKRILFVAKDGRRRAIRLGKVAKRLAESIKLRVEALNAASIAGHAVDDATSQWLAGLDDVMLSKLAAVGLTQARDSATLGAFVDSYIEKRSDVKEATTITYGRTRRNLVEFFGAAKPLREITPGDADDWRLYLLTDQGLADNTVRRRCGSAKQFFKAAGRRGLVTSNPFIDLPSSVQGDTSRFHFVTREDAWKVLDQCPDVGWRLIFALCRFGGLRCPSEVRALRWPDIDWANDRMTVQSPKTAHHPNGESRVVPIFPELRPFLDEAFELAEPGTEHVIRKYRFTNANMRTQLIRIIRRAGLKPWVKPFQNLRSTRETELAEEYPMHVVCAWIGNSQPIAAKHYLQVTDDHFAKAAQNPAQTTRADECRGGNRQSHSHKETLKKPAYAPSCTPLHTGQDVTSGPSPTARHSVCRSR